MGEVIDMETGIKVIDAPCEEVGIPKQEKPHIFAIRTGESVTLRVAFPHDPNEEGDLYDIELTPYEMSELAINCTMALAHRGKK